MKSCGQLRFIAAAFVVLAGGLCFGATAADASWHVLPIYGGGYVQNVVIAPSAPNEWYAYVDVGGPYRSDGRHWRPLHGNFVIADVTAMPTRPIPALRRDDKGIDEDVEVCPLCLVVDGVCPLVGALADTVDGEAYSPRRDHTQGSAYSANSA